MKLFPAPANCTCLQQTNKQTKYHPISHKLINRQYRDRSFAEYIMADDCKSEESAKPEKQENDDSTDTDDGTTSSVQVSLLQYRIQSKLNSLKLINTETQNGKKKPLTIKQKLISYNHILHCNSIRKKVRVSAIFHTVCSCTYIWSVMCNYMQCV